MKALLPVNFQTCGHLINNPQQGSLAKTLFPLYLSAEFLTLLSSAPHNSCFSPFFCSIDYTDPLFSPFKLFISVSFLSIFNTFLSVYALLGPVPLHTSSVVVASAVQNVLVCLTSIQQHVSCNILLPRLVLLSHLTLLS